MKIQNKTELQQMTFNHSSDIDFQDFTNYDTTLASNNSSFFINNL